MSPFVQHSLLRALLVTSEATVLSALVAFPAAFVVGLARVAPARPVRFLAAAYVEIVRGASALVELFWAYYVLPSFGINLPALAVGVLVLGLNAGAYASEAVRGALIAVPRGQWEAGTALSISRRVRMFRIILPQAIPTMLPTFGNVVIDILKGTALFSLITVTELTRAVNQLTIIGAMPLASGYAGLLGAYFLLSLPLMAVIAVLEHYARRHLHVAPHRSGRAHWLRWPFTDAVLRPVSAGDHSSPDSDIDR